MKIGYARVSTVDQHLDAQIDALENEGCEKIFVEKDSGAKDDRAELTRAIDYCRSGDIMVVWRLDRLGRSVKKLIEVTEQLETKGVELSSLKEKMDTSTAMGKGMMKMLFVLAEMEHEMIRERTKAGLESARARGRNGGRPKVNRKQLEKALKLYDSQSMTVDEIAETTDVSRATIYREVKKRSHSASF